jgi:Zn-finger nucleic acid-binding protein
MLKAVHHSSNLETCTATCHVAKHFKHAQHIVTRKYQLRSYSGQNPAAQMCNLRVSNPCRGMWLDVPEQHKISNVFRSACPEPFRSNKHMFAFFTVNAIRLESRKPLPQGTYSHKQTQGASLISSRACQH